MPGTILAGEKGGLFDFGEDILGVPVEFEISDLDQGKVTL
jgi:hypothetical protein